MPTHYTARRLRRDQTDAEALLWSKLRNRQLCGRNFRRQVPILNYIADFISADSRLIVELDGGQHAERKREDEVRTCELEAAGYIVVRFWNGEVFQNLDGVLETIQSLIEPDQFTRSP
jgi:crossover junction endodeoxyribonuclease RuvC